MNTYRIRYVKGHRGVSLVKADSINGIKPGCDTYVFRIGNELSAMIPKDRVVSVEKIRSGEDQEDEE